MIRTGIMGGTFDPVHNAHLIVARYAMEQLGLSEVWFLTSGNPPHKSNTRTNAHIRHEMLRRALKDCDGFVPCDYEVRKKENSYSALTMEHFTVKYPDREFYFIIGQDSLHNLEAWYHPEELLRRAVIPVYPRPGDIDLESEIRRVKGRLGGDFRRIRAPLFGLSSTQIRERISEGKSISFMVPEAVEKYIKEHGLYKND